MSASLLEKQSTGGAVARVGFEYQDAFVLQHLPKWLAQGAFSHVVSEAIGDVEVCYFSPNGFKRVMYEAKDYALTSTDFWSEIARFRKVRATSPSEYHRFIMVCRNYNSVTSPLLAKLERLRGVGDSFAAGSPLLAKARQEVIDWVVERGQPADEAEFVLDYVDFLTFAAESADTAFNGRVEQDLPSINLRTKDVGSFREKCRTLVSRSSLAPVYRSNVEAALLEVLGADAQDWLGTPTRLHLLEGPAPMEELGIATAPFNGPDRGQLTKADWQAQLDIASEIGAFIKNSRTRRCVAVDGKQRMSLACLLGFAFSATRGYILQIEHNGAVYRTDSHEKADGPFFNEVITDGQAGSSEGVACIGFPYAVGADLSLVSAGSLASVPCLVLESEKPFDSLTTLNLAVSEAKAALSGFRSMCKLSKVHLIVKGPSVFAVALGHRLNAVGPVQLYDWVDGTYLPTASLPNS
jgi:hypothetical protein